MPLVSHTHTLPQHIIWDWNGTLQDDVQAAVNSINFFLEERNLPTIDVEHHRNIFSFPVKHYYTALGFTLENENWAQLSGDFIARFISDDSVTLFESTVPTLTQIKQLGIGMSLVSASEQNTLNQVLADHDIRGYFEHVLGLTDHSANSKKHLVEQLLDSLNYAPSEVLMIGDTTHDKEIADSVGCPCILVTSGYQSEARLRACGCPVLPSIEHLTAYLHTDPNF